MSTDAIVFACCCVIGVFALGLEIGKQHQDIVCPDKLQGETLISTTTTGTVTTCAYGVSYGRAITKRSKT